MDDKSYVFSIPKKWMRTTLVVVATALIVAPLAAVASHNFTDVPDSNTFHADIEAIADAEVTKGCNPPANTLYCPDDFVTREQMAAFMNRLGALAPGKTPVVNAATVEGFSASELLAGSPVASIHFDAPDVVLFAEGIEEVTITETGVYCLRLAPQLGLTAAEVYAQVTAEWGQSLGSDLLAYWQADASACPDADQVGIRTYDFPGGTPALTADVSFAATVYLKPAGNSVLSISGASGSTDSGDNTD